ncbi:MAG: glycogen synthase [Patescibacteria group bacterium]|jgi:starch synthase
MKSSRILFAASEITPLAKVGGLADVVGALPKSLTQKGMDVRVILPRYDTIDLQTLSHRIIAEKIPVPFSGKDEQVTLIEAQVPGTKIPLLLIEHEHYLSRGGVYPPPTLVSETARFSFFSRAILAIFDELAWWPNIIHCHDWHVSMIPILLRGLGKQDSRYAKIKTLLTIHNLALQGGQEVAELCTQLSLSANDLAPSRTSDSTGLHTSHLAQGISTADKLSTVSPTYAQEILTAQYGAGLEALISSRKDSLVGILNGIDTQRFNPETDPAIASLYSASALDGKKKNKITLQSLCRLPATRDPVIGIVSRLTDQKGVDLLAHIAKDIFALPAQVVVLGAGDPAIERMLKDLEHEYPQQMHVRIGYDAAFAQQVYAGADMFAMPSKFEPCGLGQMIAMRYGAVPIVRATGGLADTVIDATNHTDSGNGFSFKPFTPEALHDAVLRAYRAYQTPKEWHAILQRAMKADFSWDTSSDAYIALYSSLRS